VPLYESKGKRLQAQTGPVHPPGWFPSVPSTSTEKKTKKGQDPGRGQQQQQQKKKDITVLTRKVEELKVTAAAEELPASASSADPTIEISKKLKRLRKRLREAEVLDTQIKSGEIAKPEKHQLEKVENMAEFLQEIEELEAERIKMRQLKATSADK